MIQNCLLSDMAQIVFKKENKENKEPSQLVKNLSVMLFNIFANFFNWFIIIICLFILIIGYWWLVKPKYEFIASDQELQFRAREYEDKVNYLKQLTEVKNLYKAIGQNDKDKVDLILSSRLDIDRLKIILLRELSKVGKDLRTPVDKIVITPLDNSKEKLLNIAAAPGSNPLYNKLQIVEISFIVQSTEYNSLKQFMSRLEKSLRIMDVTKVDFDPTNKQATITLRTYYLIH